MNFQQVVLKNNDVPFILYVPFILLFGLLFALLIPPFQSPDEPNHFYRAWQVSEGHFFPEKKGDRLGGMLPTSLTQVCDSFHFLKNAPSARLSGRTLQDALVIPVHPENRRFTDFANTAIYAPMAYLPQVAAIAILRPLGATPLMMLYAARLANLLIWLALVSAALRLMPFLKSTIALLAMLPSSLCIAASANADVLTNGLCWWLIAALITAPKASSFWKKLLAAAIVAANKIITVPLLLLGFSGRFNRRQWSLLFAVSILAAISWGQLAQAWFITYDAYDPAYRDTQTLNSGVNPMRQLAFVANNPVFFVKICVESITQALPSMAAHFVGKFGWEKNYLPAGWLLLLWFIIGLSMMSEKNPLTNGDRWRIAVVTVLYFGAFTVTMYTLWCAVGASRIDNWQGRYFVPIAPVVIMAVAQGWLEKWKQQIDKAVMIALILSNLAMATSIWERYFGGC